MAISNSAASAQNSTAKIRVQPNALAAKAGSYVQWNNDFDAAIGTANSSGRPIFWYVPTIRGTFMDRKAEVDRYMMAGFFSWPHIIEYLNANFVCVKASPTRAQQQQFKLSRYQFVEPGFLIIADKKVIRKVDQITTQHPDWFIHFLQQSIEGRESKPLNKIRDLEEFAMLSQYDLSISSPLFTANGPSAVEYSLMIKGMHFFKNGTKEAHRSWQKLIDTHPNSPLAAKAAAEIQGIGPYTRGLEIIDAIPRSCLKAGIASRGSRAPTDSFTEEQLWRRGIGFLLAMQRKNGSFIDSDYDFGGADSLPNVHVAVTSLCGIALLESLNRASDEGMRAMVRTAVDRCFQFVTQDKNVNRKDRDEILWADSYRLRFLCEYAKAGQPELNDHLQTATDSLQNLQSRRGGWYHEYENSFVTATALTALYNAQQSGANVDAAKIKAGIRSLMNDRFDNGAFPYYSRSGNQPRDRQPGPITASAGRMPICELALARWGHSDQNRLRFAIEQSFKHHDKLAIALKYDNHTSTLGYGGFFFWYDMRSRSEAILAIENDELRRQYQRQQRKLVMSLPEIDGCFVDSHELGRCYGTAMALLCLAASSQ